MKYLKLFENFDWNDEDFDFEEEPTMYHEIVKRYYNDEYSHNGYRFFIKEIGSNLIVNNISTNGKIEYTWNKKEEKISNSDMIFCLLTVNSALLSLMALYSFPVSPIS